MEICVVERELQVCVCAWGRKTSVFLKGGDCKEGAPGGVGTGVWEATELLRASQA